MLSVEHLSVWYDVTEVIRDVSFEVPANGIVALLGGNGAGKTTVLNTLSGLLKPRRGSVTVDGQRIDGRHPHDVVKAGLVQVPQGRFVWPSMSVADNLELGAVTRPRREKAAIAGDLDEIYQMFPVLYERRRGRAASLSGGEQQMLAIGRALMAGPRLLLMDEPSHGLSPLMIDQMVTAIRRLHERGMTILLVEQNVGVAAAVSEQAYVLVNGEIEFSTPGAELADNPDILRSYLGGTQPDATASQQETGE